MYNIVLLIVFQSVLTITFYAMFERVYIFFIKVRFNVFILVMDVFISMVVRRQRYRHPV